MKQFRPRPDQDECTLPYSKDGENWSHPWIEARQQFMEARAQRPLPHLRHYQLDPALTRGNTENFTGVIHVPVGIAGPLVVDGEFACGRYFVPLATTEGTLVASASRGMAVLASAGGARVTVSDTRMQRAPLFELPSARAARDFRDWVIAQVPALRSAAEQTSRHARLLDVRVTLVGRAAHVRLDFATGEAAGQNMVHRAGHFVQSWIREHYAGPIVGSYLSGNTETDKKVSVANTLLGRGKHVTAEVSLPFALLAQTLRAPRERIARQIRLGQEGSFLTGSISNCFQAANAVAALFLATGQDMATVAEASTAILQVSEDANDMLYMALTLPSLSLGVHGGGTQLPSQAECLDMLGCRGSGGANRLAEIIAATALACEISLMGAATSNEWVDSHEALGRNR
jgi:hydroxymethylglutaryl-CoA reductase (NADPH)